VTGDMLARRMSRGRVLQRAPITTGFAHIRTPSFSQKDWHSGAASGAAGRDGDRSGTAAHLTASVANSDLASRLRPQQAEEERHRHEGARASRLLWRNKRRRSGAHLLITGGFRDAFLWYTLGAIQVPKMPIRTTGARRYLHSFLRRTETHHQHERKAWVGDPTNSNFAASVLPQQQAISKFGFRLLAETY
jgi:hypothetical protein